MHRHRLVSKSRHRVSHGSKSKRQDQWSQTTQVEQLPVSRRSFVKEKSGRCSAESQPPGTSVIMKALKEHRVSKLREPGKERESLVVDDVSRLRLFFCVVWSWRTRCA